MFALIPWHVRLLAVVLLSAACFAAGFVRGIASESDRRDADDLKKLYQTMRAANKEDDRRDEIAVAREVVREKIRIVYVKIKQEAQSNVEKNTGKYDCSLDDDGLRLWNAANSGGTETLPGESDSTVPGAKRGTVGEVGGSAGESY